MQLGSVFHSISDLSCLDTIVGMGLWARFADRRWISVDPPEFLYYERTELVLIGGRDDLGDDLGLDLKAHPKNEETAGIFYDLHMERTQRTTKPLFEGVWE
jgi:hypothetical protein